MINLFLAGHITLYLYVTELYALYIFNEVAAISITFSNCSMIYT